jgi:hypothetical protein
MVSEGEHGLLDARRRLEEYEKLLSDKDASLSAAESEIKRLGTSLKLAVADLETSALEHEADLAKVIRDAPSSPPSSPSTIKYTKKCVRDVCRIHALRFYI